MFFVVTIACETPRAKPTRSRANKWHCGLLYDAHYVRTRIFFRLVRLGAVRNARETSDSS
jgi:hypothetical protein